MSNDQANYELAGKSIDIGIIHNTTLIDALLAQPYMIQTHIYGLENFCFFTGVIIGLLMS